MAACAIVVFSAHIAFGGLTAESSLGAAAAWAALLCVGGLFHKQPLGRTASVILAPGVAFSLVILFAILSLNGAIPGTSQPIWAANGLPRSATLDRSETLLEIVKLLGLACAFCVAYGLGNRDGVAIRTMKFVTFAAVLFLVVGIVMHFAGVGPKTQAGRLEATLLNPNTVGTVSGVTLCLCVGLGLRVHRAASLLGRYTSLGAPLVGALVSAAALWMSQSRGALVATTIAIIALLGVRALVRRWTLGRTAAVFGGFAVASVMVLASGQRMLDRFATVRTDALLRQMIFDTHWKAFLEHPTLGYGLGGFDTLNRLLLTPDTYAQLWNIRAAENVYIQWLVEGGLLLTVPMFAAVGMVIAATAAQAAKRKSMLGPLFSLLAVDMVFLIHGAFDFALQTYSVALFWAFLLGLQLAWSAASIRSSLVFRVRR